MLLGIYCARRKHRELPVLNGCRVDVRRLPLWGDAIGGEASKKPISIFFYRNRNYSNSTFSTLWRGGPRSYYGHLHALSAKRLSDDQ